jgi:DnaK suppressor protein
MEVDVAEHKKRLEAEERELLEGMVQHKKEARDSGEREVRDPMDQVVSSEGAEEQFQLATSDWRIIEEIRAALVRIENGTYGICLDCGRRIDAARLDAIPWTRYCADAQDRHDRGPGGELPAEPTL